MSERRFIFAYAIWPDDDDEEVIRTCRAALLDVRENRAVVIATPDILEARFPRATIVNAYRATDPEADDE